MVGTSNGLKLKDVVQSQATYYVLFINHSLFFMEVCWLEDIQQSFILIDTYEQILFLSGMTT